MEPVSATLAKGFLFEDRYEIQGELGSGSFSRLYEARQISTGQTVAIKLLILHEGIEGSTGNEAERFRRETQICAALSHINIVRLIDSGETGEGQLYAVFAHIPGETLQQALEREGQLGVRESLRLMTQVLEGLACAHAKGIVHRDLKPANVMLSAAGVRRSALVLDFGLGSVAEGQRRREWQRLTQTREFLGTPLYASPEQLAGEAATPRSDLYAWGLVFLECLTGRHPFEEAGAAARFFAGGGAVAIPEWLRGHPLGELLETVTTRDPAKRGLSVEALVEALDGIASGAELPLAPELEPAPPPLTESGERRHLTVMFCDLVGSTALSQQLGAETYRRVVQAYQARSAEAIERYEGHVAQYLGDGLLVYFGYPQAHEDDAERAVRAGRDILRDLGTLNTRLETEHGLRLAVRVGIHTGAVVVGEMGGGDRREMLALGDTPNIAARLEGIAEPDTVVISDTTLRLVAGLVVSKDLGTPELKGIEEPVRAHRVSMVSDERSRLDRAVSLTPFVGREQELGLLLDRWEQARERQGQAVLVGGEAGIGKSRLVHRLREQLGAAPHSWLECGCSPYASNSALHPVIELVELVLRLDDVDAPEEKVGRLERSLELAGFELAEAVPLFTSLLSLQLPERYAPLEMNPETQRENTLEALLSWVLALGEKQPLVLLVEDLHWADPSTLEWLGLLIEQSATAGALLVFTFRPDFEPPWPTRGHVLPIALSRLSRRQAKDLVAAAISGDPLPGEVVDQLAARSDGIPLFVEELARDVVESGRDLTRSLSELEIPETLQDSLLARLDRLGEAKPVAQLAAALGREFPYALLEAVAPVKEAALREGLGRLVEAELVYQRGLPPKATYTFKHALVQDTAYQTLLESQRLELHGRIADALEKHFAERIANEPEIMAQHCKAAGRTAQAISHYQRAGERATQRFAHAEAIDHLHKAIELLRTLPETPAQMQQQVDVTMTLSNAAVHRPSKELRPVLRRCLDLSERLGDARAATYSLYWMAYLENTLGIWVEARDLFERCAVGAEERRDVRLLSLILSNLGQTYFQMGDFATAQQLLERGIALRRSIRKDGSPGPMIAFPLGYQAMIYADTGRFDLAKEKLAEADQLAHESGRANVEGAVAGTRGVVELYQGDWPACRRSAAELEDRSKRIGSILMQSLSQTLGGYARCFDVPRSDGIPMLRDGASMLERSGIWMMISFAYACLAEALVLAGEIDEAEHFARRALEHTAHEDRMGEPQAKRALLLAIARREPGDRERIDAAFAEALAAGHRRGSLREEAITRLHLAEALAERDPDRARTLLFECSERFRSFGMAWHGGRSEALLARLTPG